MKRFLSVALFCLFAVAASASENIKEWTILVYAVTDSVLNETVMADIDEMETLGSNDQIEILMQVDRNDYNPVRYRIVKDDRPGFIASNIVGHPENADCGSWKTLDEFVAWGLHRAPSRRVMLVLHGCLGNLGYGAPIKDQLQEVFFDRQFSDVKFKLDRSKIAIEKDKENGARYMGIRQMGFALKSIQVRLGRKIDLVCLDDSCECSIEKFFEYRAYVDYWVGSAGFLPSDNWPYEKFFRPLKTNPQSEAKDLAIYAVEAFKEHYTPYCNLPYGFGATLTAFKLEHGQELMACLKQLSADLYPLAKNRENCVKILNLKEKVLHYLSGDEIDLKQFAEGLFRLRLSDSPEFLANCQRLAEICEEVRLAHWADGRYYKNANGVSMSVYNYLFGYDLQKYRLLEWDKFSRWSKFLVRLGKS